MSNAPELILILLCSPILFLVILELIDEIIEYYKNKDK